MPVAGLHHVAVTVANLDRALEFWGTGLGLELRGRGQVRYEHLDRITGLPGTDIEWAELEVPGGAIVELFRYHAPQGASPAGPVAPNDAGATHVCLRVTGLDELLGRLTRMGYAVRSQGAVTIPHGEWSGWRDVYVESPDGVIVELSEAPGS